MRKRLWTILSVIGIFFSLFHMAEETQAQMMPLGGMPMGGMPLGGMPMMLPSSPGEALLGQMQMHPILALQGAAFINNNFHQPGSQMIGLGAYVPPVGFSAIQNERNYNGFMGY